jgi:Ca2+-binding RTX toxin-like protein
LIVPFGIDESKKKLSQRIGGTIKYNRNGIGWNNSSITSVTQFDLDNPSVKPVESWSASGFSLAGNNFLKIVAACKSWYTTPDDLKKYQAALLRTKALIDSTLFAGADEVIGSDDNDILTGGKGKDRLIGKKGGDILTGGLDADRFIYNSDTDSSNGLGSIDSITDFNGLEGDRVDLSSIKASGGEKLSYIGGDAFEGVAGQVRFSLATLEVDINGDRFADMSIALTNTTSFESSFVAL